MSEVSGSPFYANSDPSEILISPSGQFVYVTNPGIGMVTGFSFSNGVLAPVPNGGLKVLAPPSYLVAGNLSVKLKRRSGEVFVWKKNEVEATPDRLEELARFKRELMQILEVLPQQ